MGSDISVVYYTDNNLDKTIFNLCQKELLKAAGDIPIISVSQKPLDFGANICMPDIGSSYLSIFKQMIAGLEAVKTTYVAFAEHDCLYTPEHFKLRPLVDNQVNYDTNRWHVNWSTGEYIYYRMKVFSQLIGNTKTVLNAIRERLDMALDGLPRYALSEPGLKDYYSEFKAVKKIWCEKKNRPYFRYRAQALSSLYPNLDIRHSANITKARWMRGRRGVFELPYWGNFKKYINEPGLH